MMTAKTYLGDSVYVAAWEDGLVLTTENGNGPTNTIFLEPSVYLALQAYAVNAFKPRQTTDDDATSPRAATEPR